MEIKSYKKKNGDTAYMILVYMGKVKDTSRYVTRRGFPTKAKPRAAILNLQEELEKAEENKTEKTVYEVAEEWLKEYYDTVQESTYIKTYRNIKNHIYPELGSQKIISITPIQMQEQVNAWSKKLVYGRKLKGLMNNIFKYAVRHGYTSTNPMDSVATAVKKQHDSTSDFYDKNELKAFLELVDKTGDIRKIALFRLLAFTGARKGEVLALKWDDWTDNTLDINKAVTRGFGGEEIGATKTASSKRLISLDPKTRKLLSEYKKSSTGSDYIFGNELNKPIPSTLPRKWLLDIVKDSKVRPIKIHGFRHTHASLCFEAGMTLKQVQHRLGHSDLKTTMNIYTHITKQAKDDIGERFAKYIVF